MERQTDIDDSADFGAPDSYPALNGTTELSLTDIRDRIIRSGKTLENELSNSPQDAISPRDSALMQGAQSDVSYSFIDTLQRGDITSLTVDAQALSDPRSALQGIYAAGQDALRGKGLPNPDVEFYREAANTAQRTGQNFQDVMSDMRASQPLTMREDLPPRDYIPFTDTLEGPPKEGPLGATGLDDAQKGQTLDVEPVEYQKYDVHLMGYPIVVQDLPFTDKDLISGASHAYVVVTEPGADPMNYDNVLFATRAGPDNKAGQTMFMSDSSLGPDDQSPTRKTNSGNVYVSDEQFSYENDAMNDNRFYVSTERVEGNLDEMRGKIDRLGRLINSEDIDYQLLNRNSNSYGGDAYRVLSGKEPTYSTTSDGIERYFPAIKQDVMDYTKTEFESDFKYEDSNIGSASYGNTNAMPQEEYDYGIE